MEKELKVLYRLETKKSYKAKETSDGHNTGTFSDSYVKWLEEKIKNLIDARTGKSSARGDNKG